ncbi:MAG TPA: response regulator [Terriglobales bacterium]|nr:response regulator [Terriglobales bacterium]
MSATEKVNILMVDDQPAKLLTYEVILSELGENLITAASGPEALEQLLKHDVAVVLLDVNMPGQDGFELAHMIRQHPRFEKTAIIFISAVHVSDIDRLTGFEQGAVDYISVPIVPRLLRARVRVFVELYRKTRELERLNGELRRISRRLMKMQDEEHRRIARELHDGLGQELAAVKMTLAQIPRYKSVDRKDQAANEASEMATRAIQQVRSMSHLLHPPLLDEVGLLSAVRWYLDGLTERSGIVTSLEVQPADFPRLTPDLETAIFRVIQEALTNVFRHSQANKAWITLSQQEDQVMVKVGDDGRGVNREIEEMRPGSLGIGLAGMRERAKEFGGNLRVTNANPGTLVEIVIPARCLVPQEQHATALGKALNTRPACPIPDL